MHCTTVVAARRRGMIIIKKSRTEAASCVPGSICSLDASKECRGVDSAGGSFSFPGLNMRGEKEQG